MIIKVLGVKTLVGVARLAEYIASDKGRIDFRNQGIFHNLNSTSLKKMIWEFRNNFQMYARKGKRRNKVMHVILSLSPNDRDKITMEKMDAIVNTYLQKAYPNALAFACHHRHEAHHHTHIMVSSNDFMSQNATRLSKKELRTIHLEMLDYIREQHQDLTIGIDEANWGKHLHNENEYYKRKRNPNLTLTKTELSRSIQDIFRLSENSRQFYNLLRKQGYETYNFKDRVQGVFWNDGKAEKKMRFSRLGIEKEKLLELDKQADRLKELEEIRFDQESEPARDRGEKDFESDAER